MNSSYKPHNNSRYTPRSSSNSNTQSNHKRSPTSLAKEVKEKLAHNDISQEDLQHVWHEILNETKRQRAEKHISHNNENGRDILVQTLPSLCALGGGNVEVRRYLVGSIIMRLTEEYFNYIPGTYKTILRAYTRVRTRQTHTGAPKHTQAHIGAHRHTCTHTHGASVIFLLYVCARAPL